MRHAGDIMTTHLATVSPDMAVYEALRLLHERDVRHLPVVAEGALVGMISDRDLRGIFTWEPQLETFIGAAEGRLFASIASVMSSDVVTVRTDTTVEEVIDRFLEHRVGAVPVLDGAGALVGIISYVDILRAVRRS